MLTVGAAEPPAATTHITAKMPVGPSVAHIAPVLVHRAKAPLSGFVRPQWISNRVIPAAQAEPLAKPPRPALINVVSLARLQSKEAPRLPDREADHLLPKATIDSGPSPTVERMAPSGSGWILNRSGPGTPDGGRLGASQAGVRLYWPVSKRVKVTGRLSSALGEHAQEASAGFSFTHSDVPVSLLVERRIGIRGGRNAFSVTAVASRYGTDLGKGWTLDAYGQAGLVGLRHRDAFADGAATASKRVLQSGSLEMRLGGMASAGVQPGLARVDAGPEITLNAGRWRLSASWRQRLAGNADPGSGPGLALSTNF